MILQIRQHSISVTYYIAALSPFTFSLMKVKYVPITQYTGIANKLMQILLSTLNEVAMKIILCCRGKIL